MMFGRIWAEISSNWDIGWTNLGCIYKQNSHKKQASSLGS